ncbi:MAG: ATP-grasp domain-containing protein [Candidatus Saccharimonadales bacterium]|nr:ATP-grasp domain-containing protein [Candidatus Saccharimonadales bacterium]
MDKFLRDPARDTIIFANEIPLNQLEWIIRGIQAVSETLKRELRILLISDRRDKKLPEYTKNMFPFEFNQIKVDTHSILKIEEALNPYEDRILTMVCRGDRNIPYFKRLIPHLPFVRTPTERSLDWATNKIDMRRRLRSHNKKISPRYTIVEDYDNESLEKIKRKLDFPVVVKPAQLGASVLVSVCYHEEELEKELKKVFRKLRAVHRKKGYEGSEQVLVEDFMEGTMFSTDIYVNSRGTMYDTPLVHITTGFSAGQEDFFGYKQRTPTGLKKESRDRAFEVAKEGVQALGLRSVTAHVELMKTPKGWKIIEIGPRVGGFRDYIYSNSFGINHTANDILVRLPLRPLTPRMIRGHSAVMKIFPREEGEIVKVVGLKKARKFESVDHIDVKLHKGDKALFARNGGGGVADVYLASEEKHKLLADMRRVEQTIRSHVMPRKKTVIEAVEQFFPEILTENIPGLDMLKTDEEIEIDQTSD